MVKSSPSHSPQSKAKLKMRKPGTNSGKYGRLGQRESVRLVGLVRSCENGLSGLGLVEKAMMLDKIWKSAVRQPRDMDATAAQPAHKVYPLKSRRPIMDHLRVTRQREFPCEW